MNYSEVLKYIEEKNKLGTVPGISAIKELLRRLGNPEKSVKALHIAGTNGKGSIMAYVESVLILHGFKVGRYISPAIFDFREKWQINRQYMSEEKCAAIMSRIADIVLLMEADGFRSPTTFEIETAAAFLYFAQEGCDYMLIECGMGGREDATNALDTACVRVLASISYDHMQFLGNTLEEILSEKLGIVRKGDVLISYPQIPELKAIINKDAVDRGYTVIYPDTESLEIEKSDINGSIYTYKGRKYEIGIPGKYQVFNAITATEVLESLNRGFEEEDRIPFEEITDGLSDTLWPARMSVVMKEPLFIVDGAHNRDAWERLSETLKNCFGDRKLLFILGVLADKEYELMLKTLCPMMRKVYTITTENHRALDGRELAALIRGRGIEAEYMEADQNIESAYEKAVKAAIRDYNEEDAAIVACGTLSFAGQIIDSIKAMRYNMILRDEMFKKRIEEIKEAEADRIFCKHGMDHLLSVARVATLIANDLGLNIRKDVIYATALLHDIGRWSEYEKEMEHSKAGELYAREILIRTCYSKEEMDEILHAIRCHGEDTEQYGSLAWVLYKADKLARECFNCEAYEDCFWDEDRKNTFMKY